MATNHIKNTSNGPDEEEQFVELMARYLSGELDTPGRERLERLSRARPEFRARLERYQATRDLLGSVPAAELRGLNLIAELDAEMGPPSSIVMDDDEEVDWPDFNGSASASPRSAAGRLSLFRRRSFAANSLLAAAAAAVLALALGAVWFFGANDVPRGAVLTLAHGSCRLGETQGALGAAVERELESGADSFCDLRLRALPAALRLLPDSRLVLHQSGDALRVRLIRGRVLVLAERLRPDFRFMVGVPGHEIQILGTKLDVSLSQSGAVEARLVEGKAEISSSLDRHLHPGVRAQLRPVVDLGPLREERKLVFEAGETLRLSPPGPERRALLEELLRPEVEKSAAERLEAVRTRVRAASPLALGAEPATKTPMPDAERLLVERRFTALRVVDASKLNREQLAEQKPPVDSVLHTPAPATPRVLFRVFLKNGETRIGLLEQTKSGYHIISRDGGYRVSRDEVKKIEPYLAP